MNYSHALKHPKSLTLGGLLLCLITGFLACQLTLSDDTRQFFSPDYPPLKALEQVEANYGRVDTIKFTLAPSEGDVFTNDFLRAVKAFTLEAWKIPHSTRVESLANFQYSFAQDDELVVQDLVPDRELSSLDLAGIRDVAMSEPFLVGHLLSYEGHVTAVTVTFFKADDPASQNLESMTFARKLRDAFQQQYPGIEVYLTGGVVSDLAFAEASAKDMTLLIPAMLLVMLMIMLYCLRSIWACLATIIVVVAATTTAMGFASIKGMTLSTASACAPIIIMTLSVADCIHILTNFFQNFRQGNSKSMALKQSLAINGKPVFITSLTTAIGFLSMNTSASPPFRDLGNIVCVGVIAAMIYALFLLPAMIMWMPVQIPKALKEGRKTFEERLAKGILRHVTKVFWCVVALTIFLMLGIFQLELNDVVDEYFDPRFEVRRAADFVEANLTGMDYIDFAIPAGGEGVITHPQYLQVLDQFTVWFRSFPDITYAYSFADVMKRLNKNMHGDDPSFFQVPETQTLGAQYLLLYELSLPFGHDLGNQINADRSETRMTIMLRDGSSKRIKELCAAGEDWLKKNAPDEMLAHGTGLSVMFAHIADTNIRSMLKGTLLALLCISLSLVFALRSLRMGLISLIPNVVPACMTFGLWGYLVGEIGLAVSVIAAMSLGIVVDDTIHFTVKYLSARREKGLSPEEAVVYAFQTVGQALISTSLILAAGFVILAFSGFKINAHMGLLTAIAIVFALLTDFFLLPLLFLRIDKNKT